jgi:hypothetical protein
MTQSGIDPATAPPRDPITLRIYLNNKLQVLGNKGFRVISEAFTYSYLIQGNGRYDVVTMMDAVVIV